MNVRGMVLGLISVGLIADANALDAHTRITWWVGDSTIPDYATVVDEWRYPDLYGDCIAQHTSLPQPDANLELDAKVSLTASGGLLMQAWALHGNDAYPMAQLGLDAIDKFAATASGTLPLDLALQVNMRLNGTLYVAEKHAGLCGLEHSNWARFSVLIRDSQDRTVAEWLSPVYNGRPSLTLVAETDANCNNVNYWAVDRFAIPSLPILTYDNGCGVDVCPDDDWNVLDYYIPFTGAFVDIVANPTLTLPDFQPGEVYSFMVGVRDILSGTGALDFWNTIEFDETPFVFGTIAADGSFIPLPPEDQAKLSLDSVTGAMRQPNVAVDIKPGSCPNPINTKSKGVITAAILGSNHLDVSQIDPASIHLNGAIPLRWSFEDVGTADGNLFPAGDCSACKDSGADGYADLVVKFRTQEVVDGLNSAGDSACAKVWLMGALYEAYGGQLIQGFDLVRVLRKKGIQRAGL